MKNAHVCKMSLAILTYNMIGAFVFPDDGTQDVCSQNSENA